MDVLPGEYLCFGIFETRLKAMGSCTLGNTSLMDDTRPTLCNTIELVQGLSLPYYLTDRNQRETQCVYHRNTRTLSLFSPPKTSARADNFTIAQVSPAKKYTDSCAAQKPPPRTSIRPRRKHRARHVPVLLTPAASWPLYEATQTRRARVGCLTRRPGPGDDERGEVPLEIESVRACSDLGLGGEPQRVYRDAQVVHRHTSARVEALPHRRGRLRWKNRSQSSSTTGFSQEALKAGKTSCSWTPDFVGPPRKKQDHERTKSDGERRAASCGGPVGPAAHTSKCVPSHAGEHGRRGFRFPWLGGRFRRGRNAEDRHVASTSCEEKRWAWRKFYDDG